MDNMYRFVNLYTIMVQNEKENRETDIKQLFELYTLMKQNREEHKKEKNRMNEEKFTGVILGIGTDEYQQCKKTYDKATKIKIFEAYKKYGISLDERAMAAFNEIMDDTDINFDYDMVQGFIEFYRSFRHTYENHGELYAIIKTLAFGYALGTMDYYHIKDDVERKERIEALEREAESCNNEFLGSIDWETYN